MYFSGACKLLILERETGLEPATSSLGSWHSTTELLPLNRQLKYSTSSNLRAMPKLVCRRSQILTLPSQQRSMQANILLILRERLLNT